MAVSLEHGWYCLQGRVWSGKRALEVGLVDALGGLSRAVAIAKRELKIPDGDSVTLIELSREQMSPLMLLSGGASANVVSDVVQVRGFLIRGRTCINKRSADCPCNHVLAPWCRKCEVQRCMRIEACMLFAAK
jgi:hypothetical protein